MNEKTAVGLFIDSYLRTASKPPLKFTAYSFQKEFSFTNFIQFLKENGINVKLTYNTHDYKKAVYEYIINRKDVVFLNSRNILFFKNIFEKFENIIKQDEPHGIHIIFHAIKEHQNISIIKPKKDTIFINNKIVLMVCQFEGSTYEIPLSKAVFDAMNDYPSILRKVKNEYFKRVSKLQNELSDFNCIFKNKNLIKINDEDRLAFEIMKE